MDHNNGCQTKDNTTGEIETGELHDREEELEECKVGGDDDDEEELEEGEIETPTRTSMARRLKRMKRATEGTLVKAHCAEGPQVRALLKAPFSEGDLKLTFGKAT